jgi:hypothetical protein
MRLCPPNRALLCLTLMFAVTAAPEAVAQSRVRRVEEPKWMKLRITEANAGVYAEGTYEQTTFQNSGVSVTHNRLFVGPSLGLNAEGSVYHPYLFRYRINSEGSYGWGQENIESGTTSIHRSRMEYLGRFFGTADIMANKPLNANIFGNYDHAFRDYDFFNRVTVDSLRYGARLNYRVDEWRLSLDYARRTEDSSGLIGSTTSEEDMIAFHADHHRTAGDTTFGYTYNQYTRGDLGRIGDGSDQSITVADSERFGDHGRFGLNTGASYYRRNFFDNVSDEFSTRGSLSIEHRDTLNSFHDLTYDHYQSGDFNSDNVSAHSQLRHQLYESLTSTFDLQAADLELSDQVNSGYTRRYGGGVNEGYTKRIGTEHRLHITQSLNYEHVEQQSISTVENERHTLGAGFGGGAGLESFFLNLPNVMEFTIVVTDANDSQPAFFPGIDYSVSLLGGRTLIQRLPGSRIPSGSVVLVDYHADPTAAGSYDALSEAFQIRFDLWRNLWGIYARMNLYANNAPSDLRVQSLTSYAFGSDVSWRWMRAGIEFEIYDSDQADYQSLRLFQALTFRPDPASSLALQFSEGWTEYIDAKRTEENYRFVMIYHRSLSRRLRLSLDGGIHIRRGRGVEQTLATVRPSLDYVIGVTTMRAGYDYEHQVFLNSEERSRHLFTLRVTRKF